MFTKHELLSRIEDAERVQPTCALCGEPTAIAVRDDALWIECPRATEPRGRVERLLHLDFAGLHTRRSVADLGFAA